MQSKSITFSVAGSWQRSSVLEEIRRSCRKCDKRRRFGSLLNVCCFLYLFVCFSVVLDPCGMQEEIFYYTGCEITLSRLVNQLQKKKKKCVKSFFKSWVGACCPLLEMCARWDYAFIGSLVIIHKEDEDEPEMTGGDKPWRSIAQQQLADRWLSSSPHA